MLLWLLACAPDDGADASLLSRALGEQDPAVAAALCLDLRGPEPRARCAREVAPRLGRSEALALCAQDEDCVFRVAEALQDQALCAQAGRFADDCRLHLLSAALPGLLPRAAQVGEVEALVEPAITAAGLALTDPRPWSAVYRWVLGAQRPLDRGACARAPDRLRQEACAQTALAHYNDLLNHLRDRGEALCVDPLPARAAFAPDPELEALLARRRAEDLCDPSARRPPPERLPGAGR